MKKLIQHNKLARSVEEVKLPESKNTLTQWKDLFNAEAPEHITYVIKEVEDDTDK